MILYIAYIYIYIYIYTFELVLLSRNTLQTSISVSGCYSLVWGSFLFMMNKEFLILPNAAFGDAIFGITFFLVFFPKFGKKIGLTFDKWRQVCFNIYLPNLEKQSKN